MIRNEKINKIALTGKQKCEMLRTIRKEIAKRNGIEYLSADCTHEGDCLGTCPKCDAEVRFLEYELNRKAQKGESISIIGINNDIVNLIEQVEDSVRSYVELNSIEFDPAEAFEGQVDMREEEDYSLDEDSDEDLLEYSEDESYFFADRETMGMLRPSPIEHKKKLSKHDVGELKLSAPVCHYLISSQINTLSKLCSMTEKELFEKTKIGASGMKEIKEKLKEVGLSLKGE